MRSSWGVVVAVVVMVVGLLGSPIAEARGHRSGGGGHSSSHSSGGRGGSGRSGGGGTGASSSSHAVRGYTKRDGTHVAPYRATNPDHTQTNNYSTKGNTNPWTGTAGTRTATH